MSTSKPEGTETSGIELTCARCGHQELVLGGDGRVACPGCRATFALHLDDEFALLERDGWTVSVALDVPETVPDRLATDGVD
jgi:hypothetical protein